MDKLCNYNTKSYNEYNMKQNDTQKDFILRNEEKVVFLLRSLYAQYGYLPYKMAKFEEYELYLRNKEFLQNDRVIAFNDTNGTLMALKPDVTLSIIKNSTDLAGCKQKVCYNENVYRVSDNTKKFKEIMQTGLECIGDIGLYDIYEVVTLAAKTLQTISEDFILDISSQDLVSEIIDSVSRDEVFKAECIKCISNKNSHDLLELCGKYGAGESKFKILNILTQCGGERKDTLKSIKQVWQGKSLDRLEEFSEILERSEFSGRIRIDLSVINNLKYYNGIVFRGFLDGIYESVLSGGQYDRMMARLGRKSRAIGFALYLDLLEGLNSGKSGTDVDYLILCDDKTPACAVIDKVNELTRAGFRVSVQRNIPEKLRYDKILSLRD